MAKTITKQSPIKVITSGAVPTTANLQKGELAFGSIGGNPKLYGSNGSAILDFSPGIIPLNIEIYDDWAAITISGITLQYRGVRNTAGNYVGFDLTGTTPIGSAVSSSVGLNMGTSIIAAMPTNASYSFVVPVISSIGSTTPAKITTGGALLFAGVTLFKSGSMIYVVATKISQAGSTTLITPNTSHLYDFDCIRVRYRTVNNGTGPI